MHSTLAAEFTTRMWLLLPSMHIKKPHGEVFCLELHVYLSGSEMAWPKQITAISNPGTTNHDRKRSPDTQRGRSLRPLRTWRWQLLRDWSPWLGNPQCRAECTNFKICTLTTYRLPYKHVHMLVLYRKKKATWRVRHCHMTHESKNFECHTQQKGLWFRCIHRNGKPGRVGQVGHSESPQLVLTTC